VDLLMCVSEVTYKKRSVLCKWRSLRFSQYCK